VDHFEILEHTADVGLQVQASSLEALFAQAAAGFYALALEDGLPRSPAEPARGSYAGDSWESALVHLLNELVFQLFTKNRAAQGLRCRLFPPFRVEWEGEWLAIPPEMLKLEIKSATYHQLQLAPTQGGWRAAVYFDV